jgi:type VI secretion system protein ImpE
MNAETHLQSGDLGPALQELMDQVKSNPADSKLRIFLFQLFSVLGQWKRAQTQLEMAGDMDPKAELMVKAYTDVINCERHRESVFEGTSKPLIFGEPEDWVALLVEAQQAFAKGDMAGFSTLNAKAFEDADVRSGKINDEPFAWLADADQRLGPVVEVIFNGQYYWVPMSHLKSIHTEEPSDLRDLVWLPAELTFSNGGQQMVMMPSRYPRIEGVADGGLLARRTDWVSHGEDIFEGTGQRVFATDNQDYSFLQVRSIEFDE